MDFRNVVNDLLVNLFSDVWKLEGEALITEEFADISVNDMHIIESIGPGEGSKMSVVAKKQRVTMGTLTTSMNALVAKGYVWRERSEKDRRVVIVCLTELGQKAYRHHMNFHEKMAEKAIATLSEEEIRILATSFKNLIQYFRSSGKDAYR